jgi:hypothetical protein
VLSGYEWSSGVFDCLAIRYGCVWRVWVCFDPPLCPGEPVFRLVFSLLLGFGFVFRWVLRVVWNCSDTVQLLFCLNDFSGELDGCFRMCGLTIQTAGA